MKKFKSIMKRVATCSLVLIVAVTFTVPSMTYVKADAKKPRATSVHYYPNDTVPAKERTGIKSFTLEPYTYYNMSKNTSINPSGKSTMKLDDATLERIAVNNIFCLLFIITDFINLLISLFENHLLVSFSHISVESFVFLTDL